jgi:hypothetical protein
MTPEKTAFISKGRPTIESLEPNTPAFLDSKPDESPEPTNLVELEPPAESEKRTRPKKERAVQAKASEPMPLTTPAVSVTIRFRQATAEALRRASLERKLAGVSPSSQQEMVELAVGEWLRDNDYLK